MRESNIKRETHETKINLSLALDESDPNLTIHTGVGFFDHMLTLFAAHGKLDLSLNADGDTFVDDHHTVEDVGIVLGQAVKEAVGDKRGITRYGHAYTPMDESLSLVALDLSNRPFLVYDVADLPEKIGDFDSELVEEFLRAFSTHAGITLHVKLIHGKNSHHIVESIFKGLGRAIRTAITVEEGNQSIPSTKGSL
ncbi:imidazoleglycerol-phosphate dehydratase HisB [Halalkalibacillus halophilus]|uniref:imidazoleglycerol-phosphate dehydratase HisB n=1 Tax=Halalkalibacillus halophilus TaxID=392827 RepID=UPI000406F055|nr:imidazoleglycerol-phosphate dehydratase HisB [Halalkalibacillus halophilus]